MKVYAVKEQNMPSIEFKVELKGKYKSAKAHAVMDSGATGNIINQNFVKQHGIKEYNLPQKIDLVNANDASSAIATRIKVKMLIKQEMGNDVTTKISH